jgi:hypothetical protein
MDTSKLIKAAPYAVVLAVAAGLYSVAGRIDYAARGTSIGPDFWPKLALVLMGLACLYEIGRIFLRRTLAEEVSGIAEALDHEKIEETEAAETFYPVLLAAGVALTLAYALWVTELGFVLSTFIFIVAFMYIGRYRNHVVIWLSGLIGTLVFALIFLKVVYVSLPRGVGPFAEITQMVMNLLGVR